MPEEPDDFDPQRRKLLGALGAAGAAGLAGCNFNINGDPDGNQWREEPTDTPEPDHNEGKTVEYFFDDQTGTLGNVGDENIPEDTPDWQVVDNTLEEDDWQQMQTNDLTGEPEGARAYLQRHWDESLEPVFQTTREIMENPREAFEGEVWNLKYENGDIWEANDAVVYTAALAKAVNVETSISSSGGKGVVVNSIAEPFLNRLELDIPGYSLSWHSGTESLDPGSASDWKNLQRDVAPDDVEGKRMKANGGLSHALGLLQYRDENGEQQVKYVETTGPTGLWQSWLRDPEDSHYAMPLDSEPRTNHNGVKRHPEHFVTAFEYDKARELADMADEASTGVVDAAIMGDLYTIVDDATNDTDESFDEIKSYGDTPGYDIVVEDSFGRSVQDAVYNPTTEKAAQLEYNARAFKQVMDHQGWEEPLRVKGTLEDPTYEHLARDEFEQIMEQRGS